MKRYAWLLLLIVTLCMSWTKHVEAYYTKGNQIYDEHGQVMVWNGVNWFGFETSNYVLHGLWTRNLDDILDQMQQEGYNLIRVPYSNELLKSNVQVNGVDFYQNPTLQNKKPIQILDELIEKAAARNMYILLDRHRPTAQQQSELWYTAEVSEEQWIADWVTLAKRYAHAHNVIGADLHNEPHGSATWGTGVRATDWRLAAERAGNAILAVNPNWLIVVEGIERAGDDYYWWGGNLAGVKTAPVRLNVANKIVYSPHDYGAGVYNQPWFQAANFPNNLPAIWDRYWGYIHQQQIAPILIGEFGGRSVDTVSKEGQWQRALVQYIKQHHMYWTYWSLNPNSGDTGGLLLDDWRTWHTEKQAMLAPIMKKQTVSDGPFLDIPKKHVYYEEVNAMYEAGYVTGYANHHFMPQETMKRKHVAAVLTRLPNTFEPIRPAATFQDVAPTHPYVEAITKLYRAGIIDGNDGQFMPEGELTRAQLAKILVQTFHLTLKEDSVLTFQDVAPSAWYAPYVAILASHGITTGSNGYFKPSDKVTRVHFAVFLARTVR